MGKLIAVILMFSFTHLASAQWTVPFAPRPVAPAGHTAPSFNSYAYYALSSSATYTIGPTTSLSMSAGDIIVAFGKAASTGEITMAFSTSGCSGSWVYGSGSTTTWLGADSESAVQIGYCIATSTGSYTCSAAISPASEWNSLQCLDLSPGTAAGLNISSPNVGGSASTVATTPSFSTTGATYHVICSTWATTASHQITAATIAGAAATVVSSDSSDPTSSNYESGCAVYAASSPITTQTGTMTFSASAAWYVGDLVFSY